VQQEFGKMVVFYLFFKIYSEIISVAPRFFLMNSADLSPASTLKSNSCTSLFKMASASALF